MSKGEANSTMKQQTHSVHQTLKEKKNEKCPYQRISKHKPCFQGQMPTLQLQLLSACAFLREIGALNWLKVFQRQADTGDVLQASAPAFNRQSQPTASLPRTITRAQAMLSPLPHTSPAAAALRLVPWANTRCQPSTLPGGDVKNSCGRETAHHKHTGCRLFLR